MGGTPFFSQEIENIDLLGYFEHFLAQKVTILKNRSKQSFGVVLKCFKLLLAIFRDFVNFCRFWLIFYLVRSFLKGGGGTPFLAERVLTLDPLCSCHFCTLRHTCYMTPRTSGRTNGTHCIYISKAWPDY
jgi:hypothetical protein